jgi:carbohydrate-selective porin OprB
VVVIALSDATGARGQGIGGQTIYQTLAEHGVRPALSYEAEGFVDMASGARRRVAYLDNVNLQLTLDMERLVSWRGATIFLYGGRHPWKSAQRFRRRCSGPE